MAAITSMLLTAFVSKLLWAEAQPIEDGSGRGYFVFVDDQGRITVGGVEVGCYEKKPTSTLTQRQALVDALKTKGYRAFTHGHVH